MSVSAVSSIQPSDSPDSLVPRLPSEIANSSEHNRLHMFGADDDSPSFWDLLDVINPLQHIPIINDLYREATGDKIGVGARLAGGALFGGPVGLIGAALNAVLEEATGHDAGGHLIALFRDDAATPSSGTALASAQAPNPGAEAPVAAAKTAAGPVSGDRLDLARPLLLPDMPGDDAVTAAASPAALPPLPAAAPQAPIVSQTLVSQAPVPQAATGTPPKDATQLAAAPAEPAEGKPMPLWAGRQPRLMPVPGRTTPVATQSPPAVGMTLSNNATRSNTPVTGARPNRPVITPAMAQEMAAAQTSSAAAATASGDWFSGAMMQGLSKYERNARQGAGSGTSVTSMQ